ncbi:tRNA (adenine(58)-N(1))-methyltransferase non-catalytic subunit TRM6 [Dissostichus eleginoides]|uniref:tRNA (Adenine(58)-N(1))-methyltransferase non-catalytic subunit TRM6 n=1 Tax=Dissostichus eleginoides TaxID=100907 RepID=A0AAD9F1H1_DISEL|nr:tRNA (adenine(58)-N(1))-methyltransferase non-catalytic subunit TRM6 [Dissostichus eleginoides]
MGVDKPSRISTRVATCVDDTAAGERKGEMQRDIEIIMKRYLGASDSSRLTGPSKSSPPSPLCERCDHKGDFPGLFMKAEFSGVSSRASRPYRSDFLNTWHLLFSSPSGSQV